MEKRIVIAGDRRYNDYREFKEFVDKCISKIKTEYKIIILSGHCQGTDLMAERYAKENGYGLEIFPADWAEYGKYAGPKRNKEMVDAADYAIAFFAGGPGTENLINLASKKGIPVRIKEIKI